MEKSDQGGMYFYWIKDGKVVMDRAQHMLHHVQALGLTMATRPRYVAGTFEPMPEALLEKYAAGHNASVDMTARPALAPFVEPPEWQQVRAKEAAYKAKFQVKK
jgi:hypothetical protein